MSQDDRALPPADAVPNMAFTRQSRGRAERAFAAALFICSHAGVDMRAQDPAEMTRPASAASIHMLRAIDHEAQQHARGYEWLHWSIEHIGHRLTGSPNGRKAEALADSLFRLSGLDLVERFPFSTNAWSRGTIDLVAGVRGAMEHMEAVALANTPEASDVTLRLVDAGNGLGTDLDALGDRLAGHAALMNLGLVGAAQGAANLHRSEKTALAMARGAAAVVFVNNVQGHVLLTGTASIDGRSIEVPAVCIAAEDGARLRDRMRAGETVEVRIAMTNRFANVQAHNVIAEIRGSTFPDEVVLVGGHLDSWDLATGATDNGLGAFSIIDMARCFAALDIRPLRTIRFALFMGEEQGLLGSRALVGHYVRTGEIANIRCMINLDMSGHPKGFNAAGPEGWLPAIEEVHSRIDQVDSTYAAQSGDRLGLHSDHQPFLLAGVPVISPICDLGGHVYGCYHSSCDDIHLVDPQAMVNNVRFVGMLVHELAMAPSLPPRFSTGQLRDRLIAAGLEEPLRLGGDWPW